MAMMLLGVAVSAAAVFGIFTWRRGKAEYDSYIDSRIVRRERFRRRLLRTATSAVIGASLGLGAVGLMIWLSRPPPGRQR